ncbi:hypothetical protein PIIN_05490 [Serendipita indica DSM 11827]|uniref:DUF676 domain-containing protein n=1 Tax=Serendipita indica (strain DSM 11827) TaxID=1109443 RepID=G4TJR0_SERID|nr:hypothetical protein PIIN_05490 [Serendipita indica DSM 11827]
MRRHAEGLVQALSRIRNDSPRRPIVFVAHALGGIILKWALVICHNQNLASKGKLRDILVSTHAILFSETPHSGVENTTLLESINRLASVYMETTDFILKDLRSHSSEFENIQSLYVAASEKISSVFFCEEYTTSGTRNLNVSYHSGAITGDRNGTVIVLHANHSDLVRFSSKEEESYKTVHHHLKEYVESALVAVQEKWVTEDNCRSAAKGESTSLGIIVPKPCPPVSRSYIERKEVQSLITEVQSGDFVDASSRTQIEADLEWSIGSLDPEYRKMTWKDAVAYLDGKERGWLLFIDNADSPDLDLRPYLPNSRHGAVLVTTRNSECISYAQDGAIPVGGLEEKEAVNLHKLANAHLHPTPNL